MNCGASDNFSPIASPRTLHSLFINDFILYCQDSGFNTSAGQKIHGSFPSVLLLSRVAHGPLIQQNHSACFCQVKNGKHELDLQGCTTATAQTTYQVNTYTMYISYIRIYLQQAE
jgi:hypothetical protein